MDGYPDVFRTLPAVSLRTREAVLCGGRFRNRVWPEITSDLSDAVVRALHEKTEEFNRRWKNIVECDKASVLSGYKPDATDDLMHDAEKKLPAALLDKDQYLNIASVVVDGYIRGQRITDIKRAGKSILLMVSQITKTCSKTCSPGFLYLLP